MSGQRRVLPVPAQELGESRFAGSTGEPRDPRAPARRPAPTGARGYLSILLLAFGFALGARAEPDSDDPTLWVLPAVLGRALNVTSLGAVSAPPAKALTITGSGFNPNAPTSVRFSDAAGYALEMPALVETPSSLRVAVPPYLDPSTGALSSATVDVQVIESQGAMRLESNVVPGLAIEALPSPSAPAGFVTLAVLEAIDALLPEIRAGLDTQADDSAVALRATLDAYASGIASLRTELDAIVADPGRSVTIGTFDATPVTLDAASLARLDRLMLAYLSSLLPNSPATCYGANKVDPAALVAAIGAGTEIVNGGYFGCKRTPQDPASQASFGERLAELASRANLAAAGVTVACLAATGAVTAAACGQAGLLLGVFVLETNAVLAQTLSAVSLSGSGTLSEANKRILRESLRQVMLQPLGAVLTLLTDLAISSKATGVLLRSLILNLEGVAKALRGFTKTRIRSDADGDGLRDDLDNCPATFNAGQADADGDGLGDKCDPDGDNDGVEDAVDNCPARFNAGQADADGDGVGDVCDTDDADGDGLEDARDNCPATFNAGQADADGDGLGNKCDPDDDNDGVEDAQDNCPASFNPGQADADGDGVGNVCDTDADNDGIADGQDNCPATFNAGQADGDGDGLGNKCDPDDDNDGVGDAVDNCPADPNTTQADIDGDGLGDPCDPVDDRPPGGGGGTRVFTGSFSGVTTSDFGLCVFQHLVSGQGTATVEPGLFGDRVVVTVTGQGTDTITPVPGSFPECGGQDSESADFQAGPMFVTIGQPFEISGSLEGGGTGRFAGTVSADQRTVSGTLTLDNPVFDHPIVAPLILTAR